MNEALRSFRAMAMIARCSADAKIANPAASARSAGGFFS